MEAFEDGAVGTDNLCLAAEQRFLDLRIILAG
jgi:hypothetical protein